MALNFPHNPNVNDTFTDSGKTWVWDGTTWKIYSSTTSGIGLGNLSVTTTSVGTAALSYNNTTGAFTYTPPNLSSYLTSVPTATTTTLGLVKIDGTTITINNGVISGANTYSLPTASTTVLGGVKIDGTTITISNGVISGAPSVPTTITVADESADDSCYPLFVTNSTGNLAPKTGTNLAFNSASGQLEAGSFKKTGGSSSEFLKADGSIDSNSYATASSGFPTGGIIMWSGSIATIPSGWALCDGQNSTPDLRDRFIVGAGNNYSVGSTGGSADAIVPLHDHGTGGSGGGTIHAVRRGSDAMIDSISHEASANDAHYDTTSVTDPAGVSATDANLPPYYALCFIMKT